MPQKCGVVPGCRVDDGIVGVALQVADAELAAEEIGVEFGRAEEPVADHPLAVHAQTQTEAVEFDVRIGRGGDDRLEIGVELLRELGVTRRIR